MIKIQFAPRTDNLLEDGQELTQRPYPFYIYDSGIITGIHADTGVAVRAMGFAEDLAVQHIDLWWDDWMEDVQRVADDLHRVVGLYLVTQDRQGMIGVHTTAIESVETVGAE